MKEGSDTKSSIARQPSGQGTSATPFPALAKRSSISKSANSDALADVPSIAQRLIAGELQADESSDSAGRAAFRVCEKLRQPLSSLIGAVGFRSLLSRALTLGRGEVPWLRGVELGNDGALGFSIEMKAQLDSKEAAGGGEALIAQLLGLLITFIGEALTLRLVYNTWPSATTHELGSKKNSHEKSI
jgi:hypothetical protein